MFSFSAQYRIEVKPIYPDLSSNVDDNNSNEQNEYLTPSAPLFEDVQLDNHPSNQHNNPIQSKISTPIISHQQQHNLNEHVLDKNNQQNTSDTNSNGVVLLLNANEHLTVNQFIELILINLILFLG
jgi:hypothetical protein